MFSGRGILLEISESNDAIMLGNEKEEGLIAYHGYFKGAVQG